MKLIVLNHQRTYSVNSKALTTLAKKMAMIAQKRTPDDVWQEVTIHLLTDESIAPINQALMNHEGATDVITQRYDACPGEPDGLIGELFINVQRACTIPRAKGWTQQQELALYLAHGFDHLTGADDATVQERAVMRRRERRWLVLTQDCIYGLLRGQTSRT
ncbi:MAG: rRNA maturation RNase YbeY [bacterium]